MTFTICSNFNSATLGNHSRYDEARAVPDSYIVVMDKGNGFTLDTAYLDKVVGYGTPSQREPTPAEVRSAFYP